MFIPQAALNEVKQRAIMPVKPHVTDKVSLHYKQQHNVNEPEKADVQHTYPPSVSSSSLLAMRIIIQ